jgi:ketosteroid isomerase-like protein
MMTRSVEEVFEHHLVALGNGDLDALVADYADDACLLTTDQTCVGKAAIRAFFEGLLPGFTNFVSTGSAVAVHGDTLVTAWSGESDAMSVQHGVDTFIIQDGKIQRQTFAGLITPKVG